jgi:alpha-ketoglutarate-dependent 2,4-dichlorophenoxyacetate dioxygenase
LSAQVFNWKANMAEIRFKHLKIKELHPTFAAEITEVDFSKPISPDVFHEIKSAMPKV